MFGCPSSEAIGANLDTLQGLLHDYTTGAWIALGSVLVLLIAWRLLRRRRRARRAGPPPVE